MTKDALQILSVSVDRDTAELSAGSYGLVGSSSNGGGGGGCHSR